MEVAVRFDGKAFVPKGDVLLPNGTEGTVLIPDSDGFDELMRWVEERGPVPYVDLARLDRGDLYP